MKKFLLISLAVLTCLGLVLASFVVGYVVSERNLAYQENQQLANRVNPEKLMVNVNNWRLAQNLQTYKTSQWTCDQATLRAFDIQTDNSHNGFHQRYDGTNDVAENLSEGYGNEEALNAWLASPTHAKNLHADYDYSCIRCIEDRCVHFFANL